MVFSSRFAGAKLMEINKNRKNFWWKMSYLLVYLKKVSIFAARIRENNNIKQT